MVIRHALKMVEMMAMIEILVGVYLTGSGYLPFRSVNQNYRQAVDVINFPTE